MTASWRWSAIGKHPVAADFVRLGAPDPTVLALWDWVEAGFNRWLAGAAPTAPTMSFRWWAGAPKSAFRCGILRASSDSIGRPYPLLITACGELENWRHYWTLLPFACDACWNRMEAFAAGSQRDFQVMEQRLRLLPPPLADWAKLQALQLSGLESGRAAPAAALAQAAAGAAAAPAGGLQDRVLKVPVPRVGGGDHARALSDYYGQWRLRNRELPSIVFMGGPMDAAQLILFLRPLTTDDFVGLWNMGVLRRAD